MWGAMAFGTFSVVQAPPLVHPPQGNPLPISSQSHSPPPQPQASTSRPGHSMKTEQCTMPPFMSVSVSQCHAFHAHPQGGMAQRFLPFYGQVVFRCMSAHSPRAEVHGWSEPVPAQCLLVKEEWRPASAGRYPRASVLVRSPAAVKDLLKTG